MKEVIVGIRVRRQCLRPRQADEVHVCDGLVVPHRLREIQSAQRDAEGQQDGERDAMLAGLGAPGFAEFVEEDQWAA